MDNIKDFIGIYENAFTDDYCDSVITEFDKAREQGFGKNRQELNDSDKMNKDDVSMWTGSSWSSELDLRGLNDLIGQTFTEIFWNSCYKQYSESFATLLTAGGHNIYGNKVQKTEIGEGYHVWHFEASAREVSNRVCAYILYLNDVGEGGETEFLYQHKRLKPKKGTLAIFPSGFTHTQR